MHFLGHCQQWSNLQPHSGNGAKLNIAEQREKKQTFMLKSKFKFDETFRGIFCVRDYIAIVLLLHPQMDDNLKSILELIRGYFFGVTLEFTWEPSKS